MVSKLYGTVAGTTPNSATRVTLTLATTIVATGSEKMVIVKQLRTALLDKSNYQAWRAHFTANMCGNMLEGYPEGIADLTDPTAKQQTNLLLVGSCRL